MKLKNFQFNFINSLIITTLLSASYFYGIGRERYLVKSEFAIRASGPSELNSGFSSLFAGANRSSREDGGYLMVYLKSIDTLKESKNVIDFENAYKKKGIDIFSGLKIRNNIESRYDLFKKIVLVKFDLQTGIVTLRTIAFDPKTAFKLNKFLLSKSEEFVNDINYKINKKQLNFAKIEKLKSKERVTKARENLKNFQNKNQLLDVILEVRTSNNLISRLEIELSRKKIELATLKRKFVDPIAPEIVYLKDEVEELKNQINKERALLVSPDGKYLSNKSAELDTLKSELELANSLYESSQTAIEQTRVDSIRQQRFISLMGKPFYPEKEWLYWRHKGFISTLLIYLVGFVLTKFILGMSENKNG